VVHDPALFVLTLITAVYAVACFTCWAFNVKGARVTAILLVSLSSGGFAAFFLAFGVRW
jgi:hypothetical protein